MLGIINDSFKLTNKYIILATPLILFSLITTIYAVLTTNNRPLSILFCLFMFFLMSSAFLSGWFYLVKKYVQEPDKDNINTLMSDFTSGVGEYFLPVCGMIIIVFAVCAILFLISSYFGMKYIGDVGITPDKFSAALASANGLKEFLTSLSKEQLVKINKWNILLLFTMLISYFSVLFYPPALFFKGKNCLKMFFVSLKDLFCRKFFQNLMLFLFVFVIYFILSIFTALAGKNIIANFIFTLFNFYYTVFAAVLIFNYYYKYYVVIGSNVDMRV